MITNVSCLNPCFLNGYKCFCVKKNLLIQQTAFFWLNPITPLLFSSLFLTLKRLLLKSPGKYSHASQFTKQLSFMNLECNTLLQIQKWWDAIINAFCQTSPTNNSWPPFKSMRAGHHKISKFPLPPDTHPKFPQQNKNMHHNPYIHLQYQHSSLTYTTYSLS